MAKKKSSTRTLDDLGFRNIKIVLEYNGTHYHGFQRQPGRLTIQEALEEVLSRVLSRPMKIKSASGRTDTGVHAAGQIVNFLTESELPLWRIQKSLNALLPHDIAVTGIEEVPAEFHARFSAKSKVYEYRVWNAPYRSPIQGERAWHISIPLDRPAMRKAMGYLKGLHDFKSFANVDPARKEGSSTRRRISRFELKCAGPLLRFRVEADGFLYHMVRNLAGTLIEVGCGKIKPEAVKDVLLARDRRKAGRTAPASGLCLIEVFYGG